MTARKSNTPKPLTPEEAKAALRHRGKTVVDFAKENGFCRGLVYQVLSGKRPGHRGQSHRIAVKLGIKNGVIEGE